MYIIRNCIYSLFVKEVRSYTTKLQLDSRSTRAKIKSSSGLFARHRRQRLLQRNSRPSARQIPASLAFSLRSGIFREKFPANSGESSNAPLLAIKPRPVAPPPTPENVRAHETTRARGAFFTNESYLLRLGVEAARIGGGPTKYPAKCLTSRGSEHA